MVTAPTQKWRFSAPQTHLWLMKVWFSASIPKLRDGENRHLRQARKRQVLKKLSFVWKFDGFDGLRSKTKELKRSEWPCCQHNPDSYRDERPSKDDCQEYPLASGQLMQHLAETPFVVNDNPSLKLRLTKLGKNRNMYSCRWVTTTVRVFFFGFSYHLIPNSYHVKPNSYHVMPISNLLFSISSNMIQFSNQLLCLSNHLIQKSYHGLAKESIVHGLNY